MENHLQHIKDPKEKLFVKTALDYLARSEKQNRILFTDFYNAEWMQEAIELNIGTSSLMSCRFFGGYEGAERQIIAFCPFYEIAPFFPITCLKIIVKTGIGKSLSHRDFLGALLGLGIERDKIGDIIIKPFGAYVLVKSELADYVGCMLTSIGRYQNIEIEEIAFEDLEIEKPQTKFIKTTVASLRLDAILAVGFSISRGTAMKLIEGEKVCCNGIRALKGRLLKEGDTLSLKGYGKIKLTEINGQTKKDRIHICIEKYI